MPAEHKIDDDHKIIYTTWHGVASDRDLIESFTIYREDIRMKPQYRSYDEIVDFSEATNFELTVDGIIKLVQIAGNTDMQGITTKLAIIVSVPIAFGLGRMYGAYRSMVPGASKIVRVFRSHNEADKWMENNTDGE